MQTRRLIGAWDRLPDIELAWSGNGTAEGNFRGTAKPSKNISGTRLSAFILLVARGLNWPTRSL
jgi:hypothetical protein